MIQAKHAKMTFSRPGNEALRSTIFSTRSQHCLRRKREAAIALAVAESQLLSGFM